MRVDSRVWKFDDAKMETNAQQASMLAYNTTFRILGIMFLGMIPFLLLMKRPAKKGGSMPAH